MAPAPSDSTGARRRLCMVLLVLMGFSLGCSQFVVIGIEGEMAIDLGVPIQEVGRLISAFALASAAAGPVLALTTGRFRRFQLLVVYSIVFCLGNVMSVVATSYAMMMTARLIIGAVSGGLLPVVVTFVPELTGFGRSGTLVSVIYAAYSIAMVLVTSLGKMLSDMAGWRWTLCVTAGFALAICLAALVVLPRSGQTDEPATPAEQLVLLREPNVLAGMAVFLFGSGSVYVFYGYITPYLQTILGMGTVAASGTLMAYGACSLVSNLLGGWLDARFGVRALAVTFVLQAMVLLGLFAAGPAAPIALMAVLSLGLLMYLPSVPCISIFMRTAHELHPKALTLASALEPVSFNIGISAGTAIGGMVVSGPGMGYVGLAGSVLALGASVSAVLTGRLSRRHLETREDAR